MQKGQKKFLSANIHLAFHSMFRTAFWLHSFMALNFQKYFNNVSGKINLSLLGFKEQEQILPRISDKEIQTET